MREKEKEKERRVKKRIIIVRERERVPPAESPMKPTFCREDICTFARTHTHTLTYTKPYICALSHKYTHK